MASPLIRGLHAYKADREARLPKPREIHVAVCVPDMKTARQIKRSTAVITPKNWNGSATLHVLVGNDTQLDNELRVLLASLRLFDPRDLDLVYPMELEIGWQSELTPRSGTETSWSTRDAS